MINLFGMKLTSDEFDELIKAINDNSNYTIHRTPVKQSTTGESINEITDKILRELGIKKISNSVEARVEQKNIIKLTHATKENEKLKAEIKAMEEEIARLKAKNTVFEKQNKELDSLLQAAKEEIKGIKTENELVFKNYQNRSDVERIDNKLIIKKYIKNSLVNTQSYTILENGEIFKEYGMRQLTENIGTKEGKEKFYQAMYKTGFKFNEVLKYLCNTQHWIAKAYIMEFLPVQKNETPDLSMFREQLLRLIAWHEQYYQSVARKKL